MNRFLQPVRYTLRKTTLDNFFYRVPIQKDIQNIREKMQLNKPIQAVILDWSGTTVDKYVTSEVEALRLVFAMREVPITWEEVTRDMGMRKDLHIQKIPNIDIYQQ